LEYYENSYFNCYLLYDDEDTVKLQFKFKIPFCDVLVNKVMVR